MTLELKLKLYNAINKTILDEAEGEISFDYYIHPNLIKQMTDAAELVFDSSQEGQEYYVLETV